MPFNRDDIRASHTIRIFGTNEDDEVLQDIWLDIERVDVFCVVSQDAGHSQEIYRRLYWFDNPWADDYRKDGNPARTEGLKKICSPDEEDQENPKQWVPVKNIIEMTWNESSTQSTKVRGNRTSADNEVRSVQARRCFYRETIIDDDVDKATEQDPTLTAYVVASDKYNFKTDDYDDPDDETKDETNYIEVQYVSYTYDLSTRKEDKDQVVQFNWKNEHYLRFTKPAEGPVNEVHGFDPPWALDPFQAIVNCNFSTGAVFAIGDNLGIIWGVKTRSKKDAETKSLERVGQIGPGGVAGGDDEPGVFLGGSYALVETGTAKPDKVPTFLLGGYHFVHSDNFGTEIDGVIMISKDGKEWSRAWDYTLAKHSDDGSRKVPGSMTWDADEKKFYLVVDCKSKYIREEAPIRTNECWSSPDGRSWTVVQSGVPVGTIPSTFTDHCQFKWEERADSLNGTGIPDGFFGLDPSLKDSTEEPAEGKIIKDKGHYIDATERFPDGQQASMITFVNKSQWGRVGYTGTGLDVSFDHAKTWTSVKGEVGQLGAFNGFCAAPAKDIKKDAP